MTLVRPVCLDEEVALIYCVFATSLSSALSPSGCLFFFSYLYRMRPVACRSFFSSFIRMATSVDALECRRAADGGGHHQQCVFTPAVPTADHRQEEV